MRSLMSGILALALAAAAVAVTSGAGQGGASPEGRGYAVGQAPEALKPAAAKAQQAFDEFQTKLIGRMNTALADGGPLNAVSVYRDEAAALTASIGRERGMRIGRTSHKLRNPKNGPPVWAAPYVKAAAASDFKKATTWVVPIGENVGVLAPLETKEVCTLCHGPADKLPPELLGAIRKHFPGDRATGFAAGQVRGWIWAEVPKR